MGIKEIVFIIFLISTISFPFFFSKKDIKIEKTSNLPYVFVKNGSFKNYENSILTKKGNFDILNYFNNNSFDSINLKISFLDKNSTLYTDKLVFDGLYNLKNAKYITSDYTYLATKAIYNEKQDILTAYNFKFFNKKIEGKGNYMIYENNIIKADNIHYTIKGFK